MTDEVVKRIASKAQLNNRRSDVIPEVPEVTQVGRRTGRAELDEHAEGVHTAEIDVDLKRSERDREAIMAHTRYISTRLAGRR